VEDDVLCAVASSADGLNIADGVIMAAAASIMMSPGLSIAVISCANAKPSRHACTIQAMMINGQAVADPVWQTSSHDSAATVGLEDVRVAVVLPRPQRLKCIPR
jgi:hypothetical protein